MTEEQQIEENNRYVEWEYEQYKGRTENPASFEEWMKNSNI
jgi:hypothetical protein